MTSMQQITHPLRECRGNLQIKRVAVVDDAFDKVSSNIFQEGELIDFISVVNEDDQLIRDFHRLISDTDSEEILCSENLSDDNLALLWDRRAQDTHGLKEVLQSTLFRIHEPKVLQVERLCQFLAEQLEIEKVERFGTTAEYPSDPFDIAFIDYRFGPSRQEESVDRAVRWARHFYEKGQAFIILMSAEVGTLGRRDDFREKSTLTRGLFEYLDKEEIEDSGKFCNRLNSFCAGLSTRHKIHDFAKAAEEAADEALVSLKKSIHALGLEDYAHLEHISLHKDGHPLGDYMLWLLGEYFAHNLAVNSSLQAARKSVNSIKYDRLMPFQRPPSTMLAKMYSAAITEPVHEGWGPHPRVAQETEEDAEVEMGGGSEIDPGSLGSENVEATVGAASIANVPLYQLGDLLVATKEKPVYMVLNAGCDLQFSPEERKCDMEQSILLIPGHLEKYCERGSDKKMKRTELFELGEERFRIVWQRTRVKAYPHKEIRLEFRQQGYERKRRLKLPYALEVQQYFAAQLTRIGLPTPTPVFSELDIEVYGKDAEGNCQSLGPVRSGMVVYHHHRSSDQFVLTVDCVQEVLNLIDGFIAEVKSEAEEELPTAAVSLPEAPTETTPRADTKAKRRKKYLEELIESRRVTAERCVFQYRLHDVPKSGETERPKVDGISESDRQKLIKVKHSDSLTGEYLDNAPVILTFSLSVTTATSHVNTPEIEKATRPIVDEAAANSSQEEPPR